MSGHYCPRLRGQWPELLMDVERLQAEEERERITASSDCLTFIEPERHAIVFFYRDERMKLHMQEQSYVLDSTGEGPFALHFRKRHRVLFELAGVREVDSADKDAIGVAPYRAMLCSPEILEITLVSPTNSRTEPFSQQILQCVLASI